MFVLGIRGKLYFLTHLSSLSTPKLTGGDSKLVRHYGSASPLMLKEELLATRCQGGDGIIVGDDLGGRSGLVWVVLVALGVKVLLLPVLPVRKRLVPREVPLRGLSQTQSGILCVTCRRRHTI